jgi:hypothetical protein
MFNGQQGLGPPRQRTRHGGSRPGEPLMADELESFWADPHDRCPQQLKDPGTKSLGSWLRQPDWLARETAFSRVGPAFCHVFLDFLPSELIPSSRLAPS